MEKSRLELAIASHNTSRRQEQREMREHVCPQLDFSTLVQFKTFCLWDGATNSGLGLSNNLIVLYQ